VNLPDRITDGVAVVSVPTYLGVTIAQANEVIQLIVGVLTAVSLVIVIIKKLRE